MKQKSSPDLVTKTYLDIRLDEFSLKIDDKAREYRDEVLTKLDQVIGELQTIRDENTIGLHHTKENTKTNNDHEKRITKLEQVISAT